MKEKIRAKLSSMKDVAYRDFSAGLLPQTEKNKIIGTRLPLIRKMAREIIKSGDAKAFINDLPHFYLEEYHLHSFLIGEIKCFSECIKEVNRLLPYVDNWAVCDSLRPRCFKNNKKELYSEILGWLSSEHIFTVRFGIEMLMIHFMDSDFSLCHLELVAKIRSEEYYLNMMISWYFATALSKQYDKAIAYLEEKRLSVWCHNKTISKAIESRAIPVEVKKYLRNLKI